MDARSIWRLIGGVLLCRVLFGLPVHAQTVTNGSFEQDGLFSVVPWQFTDPASVCWPGAQDTPLDGGTWSLKIALRNYQGGCFPVAYQLIPQARNGEVWRLSGWARKELAGSWGIPRLYWTTFAGSNNPLYPYYPLPAGPVDSTSSEAWTLLTVIDTLEVAEGDSVGIVLDPGATSGPTSDHDWSYFDLITAEKIGDVSTGRGSQPDRMEFGALYLFPRPVQDKATVGFHLGQAAATTLDVHDLLGREVATLMSGFLPAGPHEFVWAPAALPSGVYLFRLQTREHVAVLPFILLRE